MTAYYNEIDPFAAQWLRELIKAGMIAPGEVDERSIEDVIPKDLMGFSQCHFFAGIGIWSYALRQAGWPDDRPVWTGSCPCQPFSAAGKRIGLADERNLWPAFEWLIRQCRPDTIFGEQVESAIKHDWLDHVALSLEDCGYTVGAVGFPACSVGAPHIRQRLYWVADSKTSRHKGNILSEIHGEWFTTGSIKYASRRSPTRLMADAERSGQLRTPEHEYDGANSRTRRGYDVAYNGENAGILGDSGSERLQGDELRRTYEPQHSSCKSHKPIGEPSATNSFWADAEWLPCRDGKARPTGRGIHPLVLGNTSRIRRQKESRNIQENDENYGEGRSIYSGKIVTSIERPTEPGTFPLAHGAPARVGRLRGYGNAIVAPQATEFIRAFMEIA